MNFVLRLITIYFIVCFFYLPEYLGRIFGNVDVHQLLFFGLLPGATSGTDWYVIERFVGWVIVRPMLATSLIILVFLLIRKYLTTKVELFASNWALSIFFLVGIVYNLSNISFHQYIKHLLIEDKTEAYFLPIEAIDLTSTDKKNLIFVYVESLETTFGDHTIVGSNLNRPLDRIAGPSNFQIRQISGTSWTTAGLISSQCGVPVATYMGNMLGYRDGLLPNLTCLSDILEKEGYTQTFLVGTDVSFSGMDKFYNAHGFDRVRGKYELESHFQQHARTGWGAGLHDDTLLNIAHEEIIDLHAAAEPFHTTIVLTDNHAPDGLLSPRCEDSNHTRQIHKVIQCTNERVEQFIKKLDQRGILSDTVIIIMGDHLFMGDVGDNILKKDRRIYFNYISQDKDVAMPSLMTMSHFDVYPMTLALALGVEVDQIHLGVNVLTSPNDKKADVHNYVFGNEYSPNASFFKEFW